MGMAGLVSVSIVLLITLNRVASSRTAEKAILDALIKDYDSNIRPTDGSGSPINIKFDLKLSKIVKLNFKEQQLHTHMHILMRWTDKKLKWNKSQYNETDQLVVPASLFWTPDILLYNTADEKSVSSSDVYKAKLQIDENGTVTWMSPVTLKSSCDINVKWFPFDIQKCSLIFGSISMTTKKLKILFLSKPNSATSIQGKFHYASGIWSVQSASAQLREEFYPCCKDPFSLVDITLTLKRLPMYYVLYLVLPCLCLSFLSPCVFLVPPESGERIGFGITIVLSMSVYLLVISDKLPEKSNEPPLIGVLYIELFFIMIASLLAIVFTTRIAYKATEPPRKLCQICCHRCTRKRRKQQEIDVVRSSSHTEIATKTDDGNTEPDTYGKKAFALATSTLHEGLTVLSSEDEKKLKNQTRWKEFARRIDGLNFWVFLVLTIGLPMMTTILYMA